MNLTGLDRLPEHMRETARLYVERGIPGGSFFTALVRNNLVEAFNRADDTNTAAMREWANWLYNHAPGDCWGSSAHVKDWIDAGGMIGIKGEDA